MLAPNGANNHYTQLYRDHKFLEEALSYWLTGSLQQGGAALILATPQNRTLTRQVLKNEGFEPARLQEEDRLILLDVDAFLEAFLKDGVPDPTAFNTVIDRSVHRLRKANGNQRIHAWGEAVEVLRQRRQYNEASLLEVLWNEAIEDHDFSLLCSYNVDNLDPRTHQGMMAELTDAHTYKFTEPDELRLNDAVHRSLHELYGEAAANLIWAAQGAPRSKNVDSIGQHILDHSTRNHNRAQTEALFEATRKNYESGKPRAMAKATHG